VISGAFNNKSVHFVGVIIVWLSKCTKGQQLKKGKIILLFILNYILVANRKTKDSAPNDSEHCLTAKVVIIIIKETTKSSHIGHCTQTTESASVKVQNTFHGRTDCK
jgi:hypothetical protein